LEPGRFLLTGSADVTSIPAIAEYRVVGVEVKKTRSVQLADFRGLQKLAEAAGERFTRGILLHAGTKTLAFEPALLAVPLAALWTNVS
jgi:hypothetical protein